MRKRIQIAFFCAMICLFALTTAFAADIPVAEDMSVKIYDNADIIESAEEEAQLQETAQALAEKWQLDIVILTTTTTAGMSAEEYGAAFYDDNGFGYGENADGILLVVDMSSRVGKFVTTGKGVDIFTDYYMNEIWEEMRNYMKVGNYFGAMQSFLTDVDHYCEEYEAYLADPNYVTEYQQAMQQQAAQPEVEQSDVLLLYAIFSAMLAIMVAVIGLVVMRRGYVQIKPATDGTLYLEENSLQLHQKEDRYLTSTYTKVPIQKDDDNHMGHGGGFGGGTTVFRGGSGRSHGVGGGSF